MKRKWLIAFMIHAYVMQILLLIYSLSNKRLDEYSVPLSWIYLALLGGMVFLFIINFVYSIKLHKLTFERRFQGNPNPLKTIMFFKIAFIPYFIINFFFWFCVIGILLNPVMAFIGVALIPVAVISTYLTMLITSIYGISIISAMGRNKALTLREYVIHIICQLIFIVDVVDIIYLNIKYKKIEVQ